MGVAFRGALDSLLYSTGQRFVIRDMPKKVFTEGDLIVLFRMKNKNYSIKQIADVLNCGKSAVKMRISRAKLVAGMPPKEKLSRSAIKGRLANSPHF